VAIKKLNNKFILNNLKSFYSKTQMAEEPRHVFILRGVELSFKEVVSLLKVDENTEEKRS